MNKLIGTALFHTACRALMAWALLSLGAPVHAEQFGNMRFGVPAGWTTKKSGDALFLVPPNLATDQAALLVMSPGLDLRDFNTQFELLMKKAQGQRSVVEVGKLISTQSRDGHNVLRRELVLREPSGATLHMLVAAANANQRFESMYFAANNPALFAKLAPQVQSLVNTTTFSTAQQAPTPQPAVNAAADVPRAAGAPQVAYTDPKSRAKGEANLSPPPPGRARLNGLYATQETGGHVGPGGLMYQDFNWRFYYFLPNGYVYLGSKDAGLEDQNCTRPTVNKYGDPVCTTYSADNDQLRIGTRNPVRLRHKGDDLLIGDYEFASIPQANNLRLNGTYGTFSAGTAAASGSGITFSRDGRFTSSNFVGVAIDTGQGAGQPAGGSRVTVSGGGSSNAEGSYRINGYTLELNYSDGRKTRAFFAQVAGTEAVRIGSRVYTRSGAK